MSEATKRHDSHCGCGSDSDAGCDRGAVCDRAVVFEAMTLVMVSALAAIVAGIIDASLWPIAIVAGGAMALIHAAAGLWLQREIRENDARAVPFIWLKVGGVRFLAVPAIGLAMILILGADPVASLAPPLAVYSAGLVIDTFLTRRRILGGRTGSTGVAQSNDDHDVENSVRMMEAST